MAHELRFTPGTDQSEPGAIGARAGNGAAGYRALRMVRVSVGRSFGGSGIMKKRKTKKLLAEFSLLKLRLVVPDDAPGRIDSSAAADWRIARFPRLIAVRLHCNERRPGRRIHTRIITARLYRHARSTGIPDDQRAAA
jgi:hypothetical protein